ncbi:MAG: hypothetical protein OEY49_14445 [Candidatus Heimdallarchaeota archaeon]|nr:hypothetical protein [Candidatus Heimdallarchaeota archaeon]
MSRRNKVEELNQQVKRRKSVLNELVSLEQRLNSIQGNLSTPNKTPVTEEYQPPIQSTDISPFIIENVKNQLKDLIITCSKYLGDKEIEIAYNQLQKFDTIPQLLDVYINFKSKLLIQNILQSGQTELATSILFSLKELYG